MEGGVVAVSAPVVEFTVKLKILLPLVSAK
jgi:hypothetical protein